MRNLERNGTNTSPLRILLLLTMLLPLAQRAQVVSGAQDRDIQALDFPKMMQPIPASAAFHDPGYYVWCGTMVEGNGGEYHLYYSRWKKETGSNGWLTSSEIAHAVGKSPTGPFAFHDVALPRRAGGMWDGMDTHNPTVKRFGRTYYLYYMGNTGDGVVMAGFNWTHRNHQRIGVAVADNPNGPWKRYARPLIDISKDSSAPDALCVSNPSLSRGRDGRYYLLYKAVGRQRSMPFGGPVVHLMAVSTSPTGRFKKDLKPLFTVAGQDFPFEDPFFWFDRKRNTYFVIMKDNKGIVSGTGHSTLVLYQSANASDWDKADHLLVSDLKLHWKDRPAESVMKMERPQLLFDPEGAAIALIVAVRDAGPDSYNVRIPLAH